MAGAGGGTTGAVASFAAWGAIFTGTGWGVSTFPDRTTAGSGLGGAGRAMALEDRAPEERAPEERASGKIVENRMLMVGKLGLPTGENKTPA
jgi:hypothetical protein